MKKSKNSLVLAAVGACCLVVVWLSTSIKGSQKTYELRPQITVPEYRTDAARAIDAYERLMDRYIDLTEKNLFRVATDIQEVAKKLDLIEDRLRELRASVARVEKALGIEQPDPRTEQMPQSEAVGKQSAEMSLAPAAIE